MNKIDNFKPWQCDNGHLLTIKEVTYDGKCLSCSAEVHYSSTKEAVAEALREDECSPEYKTFYKGEWHNLIERECTNCFEIYETIYRHSKYCSPVCRKESMSVDASEFIRPGYIKCIFCEKEVPTNDARVRFCNKACREDNKRLKVKSE